MGSTTSSSSAEPSLSDQRKAKTTSAVGVGRTALITGANSGLGFETAAQLAAAGFTVIVGVRSVEKGDAAIAALVARVPEAAQRLSVAIVDVSSLSSVRAYVESFLATDAPLHVLICNAGIMMGPQRTSVDGFDLQFATNYLGHFLMTELLLERLAESASRGTTENGAPTVPSRIVHVSSIAARRGSIRHDDLMHTRKRPYSSSSAYCQSKLCQVVYSWHLAKRLAAARQLRNKATSNLAVLVTTNSIEPGVVATNLSKGITDSWLMRKRLEAGITVEEGARTQVAVAASMHAPFASSSAKEENFPSGLHFRKERAAAFPRAYLTDEHAQRLFVTSRRLAGLVTDPAPTPPPPSSKSITASPLFASQSQPTPGAIRDAAAAGDLPSLRALLDTAQKSAFFLGSGGAGVSASRRDDDIDDARQRVSAGEFLALLEDRDAPNSDEGPAVCAGHCPALVWAAYHGHTDCALEIVGRYRTCFSKGAGAVVQDAGESVTSLRGALVEGNKFGENAFMWAAARGHLECMSRLWRECYIPIFMEDISKAQLDNTSTQSHEAGGTRIAIVQRCSEELLAELQRRNYGRAPWPMNGLGRTAAESARARGHTAVLEFISNPPMPQQQEEPGCT